MRSHQSMVFHSTDSNFVLPKTLRMLGMYNFSQIGAQEYPAWRKPTGRKLASCCTFQRRRSRHWGTCSASRLFLGQRAPNILSTSTIAHSRGLITRWRVLVKFWFPYWMKSNIYECKVFHNPDDPSCYVTWKGFCFQVDVHHTCLLLRWPSRTGSLMRSLTQSSQCSCRCMSTIC